LCDATTDPARHYTIEVQDAVRVDRPQAMHDGSTVVIPDTSIGPTTTAAMHPHVIMPRSASGIEFGLFKPDCSAEWAPNWRILGHELCGHGRLRQSYPGKQKKGDRAGHDKTIDTENAIAAEHGGPARGHYGDPRQGESFHNPVGDRTRIVFALKDGWHYEAPDACLPRVAPPVPAIPPSPVVPPGPVPSPGPVAPPVAPVPTTAASTAPSDFRFTLSAVGGVEARELQSLGGVGAQLSLRTGPLVVYNPIIGLNLVYAPSDVHPHEFLLAMARLGLRIQEPVRGAFLDLTGGGFVGFDAQAGAARETTGGLGVGLGIGWRSERIELGAEASALFPLTEGDPTRILVLGKAGFRFGR
jgi:hypothetical protein